MRRLMEAFPAQDAQGRRYEVSVYAEFPDTAGGELIGTAQVRVVGTDLVLPAVRVTGDLFRLVPGGLELKRIGGAG
jgi:hypothetical protein